MVAVREFHVRDKYESDFRRGKGGKAGKYPGSKALENPNTQVPKSQAPNRDHTGHHPSSFRYFKNSTRAFNPSVRNLSGSRIRAWSGNARFARLASAGEDWQTGGVAPVRDGVARKDSIRATKSLH
jgi:hypothetical protein